MGEVRVDGKRGSQGEWVTLHQPCPTLSVGSVAVRHLHPERMLNFTSRAASSDAPLCPSRDQKGDRSTTSHLGAEPPPLRGGGTFTIEAGTRVPGTRWGPGRKRCPSKVVGCAGSRIYPLCRGRFGMPLCPHLAFSDSEVNPTGGGGGWAGDTGVHSQGEKRFLCQSHRTSAWLGFCGLTDLFHSVWLLKSDTCKWDG